MVNGFDRRVLWVFAIAFALAALLTKTHTDSCNDMSRIAAIDSLAERHTFRIEQSPWGGTCDRYTYAGHFYSDKEPLLIVMGAVVELAMRPFHVSFVTNFPLAYYLVTLFTVGLCFAAGTAYAYVLARLLGLSERIALVACRLMAVATPVLTWAVVLANHVPCGMAVLAGATHCILARRGAPAHAFLAGLFIAIAAAFDAAAVVFFLIPLFVLPRRSAVSWIAATLGALPLLAAQAAFNLHFSGSVIPPAMNGNVWDYPGSLFKHHYLTLGVVGSADAYKDYAWYLTFGDKGLFTYSPAVVLCIWGLVLMWRNRGEQRILAAGIAASCAVFLVLTFLFTDDHSAGNYGERRYADFLALLCVALGPLLAAIRSRWAVWAVRLVVLAGIVMEAIGTVSPWTGNPGFTWNLDRFHTIWLHAPWSAAIDVLGFLGVVAVAMRAIRAARGESVLRPNDQPSWA
ncbi:MAG TPA: hypothetical protein VFA29_02415 [Candidatus Baltobacteraceae bacterium]|nr:hypothetical protein [Candidatus Baltobacteraceae bacterium]